MKQQHRVGLTMMLLIIMFGVLIPENITLAYDTIIFAIGAFLFLIGDD